MRRYLLVALVTVFGMLVWASGAFAADSLTLCIAKTGNIRAATTCKSGEATFEAVSKDRVVALEARVTALETLLAGVTRTAGPTLLFTGMNLQVVNGSGATDGTMNSLGNLIIGYNTNGGEWPNGGDDTKTGSHNLVVGDDHSYTSTSGIVAGNNNILSGLGSFVSGHSNTAGMTGIGYSFVAGGEGNTASGDFSFASGRFSRALGLTSFVAGFGNTASGVNAFASGRNSTASGNVSFASGWQNTASGPYSFVSGGPKELPGTNPPFDGNDGPGNTASGPYSFVAGGEGNIASGPFSFVGGGLGNTAGPGSCANIFGTFFPGPAC